MADTKTLIDINKQAGEMQNLQPVSASRSQMESMIAKYFSHGSSQNHLQEPDPSRSVIPIAFPSPRKSPEPPDFNQSDPISEIKAFTKLSSLKSKTRKLAIPLKYSCDEIYDRMTNGLCIFCEEQDTPDHQLKHKRFQIFMKESDDRPSDDMSLESAIEEIYDECVVESVDHVSVALDQEGEQGSDEEEEHAKTTVQDSSSRPNEYQDDSATQIKPSNDIQLSFSQEYSGSHRSTLSSLEMDQCISDRNCNEEKRSNYLSRGDRIWEPGGLSAIMEPEKYHTHDNMMELPSKLHKMGTQQNSNGVGILDSFSELIDSEGVKKKLSYMKSLKVNEVAFHVYGGSTTGYVIISLPQWVLEIGKENLSDCEGRSFECLNWSTDKELVLHGLSDFLLAKRVWEPGGISDSDGAHTLLLISGHLATQKFSSVKEISVVSPKGTSVTGLVV